ncbi:hypothetical protein QR77_12330 [Streptomyces sp. 150FB]|uniref:hypothetical protein n=1 Tax=Streptomyces sp. 150FB TaxID=1576605 RepID=UPI000589223A|nr:hypothetical protein [Streptomyces sp. 150FB]KIF78764.1 hypothetical protein QR77_12330 [Streptomyces sp. 150FB]
MRTGLVHAAAWSLATCAATMLSWWGVHTVMAGTAYDPPRAVPITRDSVPVLSSTQRPESPTAKPSPSVPPKATTSDKPKPTPGSSHRAAPPPSSSAHVKNPSGGKTPDSADTVKGYTVDGGRVVLGLGPASAELVSATPDAGWQMQVWTEPAWIRVTFTRDGREVSVFCTWNDHPPAVEFDDR